MGIQTVQTRFLAGLRAHGQWDTKFFLYFAFERYLELSVFNFSFFFIINFSVLILCHPGAQIHNSHHSDTYDVGAARVVVFGVPLWLDVKPPRVILQVRARNLACLFSFGLRVFCTPYYFNTSKKKILSYPVS